jgi:hypothetical protein
MMLQRAYNDGHFIGMTYRAPSDSTKGLTDDQIKADVTNTAKIIETLIGVAPKYIRLHYSEPENTRLEGITHDLGYVLVGYNLDTADYNFKNNPSGIANVYKDTFFKQMETYDSKGSFISVQYDIPDTGSYQAIYDVIKTINDNGYTMVRLDGCLNDKEPYKEHAASKKFVNDKHSLGQANYKLGQIAAEKPAELIDPQVQEEDQMVKDMTEKVSASTTNTFEWSHLGFALSAVIYVLFF